MQLKDMGFPEDLATRALVKVKNESVAAAVEAVVALQAGTAALPGLTSPKVEKKVTLTQWICERCTVVNAPGGSTCHVCFGPAPDNAFVDEAAEKAKKETEKKHQEGERAKAQKAKEEEEQQVRLEEQKRLAQVRHREQVEKEFEATKAYLHRTTVKGFLYGSIQSARDRMPLFVGAVLNDNLEGVTDVHLKGLEYRKRYLGTFIGHGAKVGTVVNRLTSEDFPDSQTCLKSLLTNNQALLESLYPALGGETESAARVNPFLRSKDLGVVRLPLKEVSAVCQLGTDVSANKALSILVIGQKQDSTSTLTPAAYLLTLQHATTSAMRSALPVSVRELQSGVFEGM
jgi:hypothetical protein